jgi:hypothetical protein
MFDQLPPRISKFAKKQKVGHLSVRTKRGVLVHPIAYHIQKSAMVFGTPRTAKKLDMLKKNPRVSFTVDNGKLMKEAVGITVLGRTETFGLDDLAKGAKLGLASMAGFMRKYPELVKYYVKDFSDLPDANKFWKYVFVRVNPTSIVHWDGYEFGRISAQRKKKKKGADEGDQIRPEDDPVIYAKYVQDYYKGLKDMNAEFDEDFDVERLAENIYSDEYYAKEVQEVTLDATTLLSLPENLRKTGLAILKLEKGTMENISAELGSSNREAKNYLDRLTLMKMLNKKREGDQLVYYVR